MSRRRFAVVGFALSSAMAVDAFAQAPAAPVPAPSGEVTPPVPPDPQQNEPKKIGKVEPPPAPAGGTVTFAEAIQRAVSRNPSMLVATEEINRFEAIAKQVRASWLPTLNANGIYTRLDNDRELNGRIILAANQLSMNVIATVPIIAPRQWAAWSRSKENIGVARTQAADVRRDVALATGRAYLTVIGQKRVLNSSQRALNTAKAHEEYATTRFQGGVGNRLDAVRAGQERATAEVRVKSGLAQLARAQEALGLLLGDSNAVDAADDPRLAAPATVEAAMSEVATSRPDITVERERVETARKAVRDSYTDYLPLLSAVGQPFYQNPATLTQPITGWQVQLVLQIPLFDGGQRYGLADERRALESQARARLDGVLREARSEVRIAFEQMRRADEALTSAREAAKLSREALELAQLAYSAGATTNIEVVDAERRTHEAETAAAIAEDASRQARLDLLAASGRFPQ